MSTIRGWFSTVSSFIMTISRMITFVWHVQPACFVGLLVIMLVQGVIPLGTAWLIKILFDLLGQSLQRQVVPTLWQHLLFLLMAQAGLTIVSQFVNLTYEYLNAHLERNLSLKFQTSIYEKINSFVGLSYFEDPHFHNTIKLATSGALSGPLQSLTILTSLIQGTITVSGFVVILIYFNPLLAGIIGIAVLPELYVRMKFGRQRFHLAFTNSPKERRAMYYGQLLTTTAFAKEIRLFDLGDYFLKSFVRITEEVHHDQIEHHKGELRWRLLLSLITSIVGAGTFVIVIIQAFSGHLSLGDITLYTSAVSTVQGALLGMITSLSRITENALFYRQYTDLLALPEPLLISSSAQVVPPLTTGITLRHISFRYNNQQPWVLRDVNLFLPAGKCLALVGMNGTGKTTLVKLLTRLYEPTEGQILWDGIDIREFEPRAFRQRIGVIFQDFARYDLTIQHNIGVGNVARIEDDECIQQAAIKAGIHDRVTALPQKYHSSLGRWLADDDTGIDLSGGEWQKIALARMFMRKADMLILDEPTASLDAQAEYELYTQFRELMQGRTCLLISHRFGTVCMADSIAVLEQGQITEQGMHEELVSRGRTYAHLYTMQAEHYR